MDFDDLDEHLSFEEEVARARSRILQSSSVTDSYDTLIDKYSAFKDVLREAKKRGELISSVLVAAECILRCSSSFDETAMSWDSPRSNLYNKGEERLLWRLQSMYMHLYSNYPVPTTQQWKEAVISMLSDEVDIASIQKDLKSNMPVHFQYLRAPLRILQTSKETGTFCEVESDDGSFVDTQFMLFLKRLLILGRKCVPRSSAMDANKPTRAKSEVLQTVRHFINSNSIDW